MNEIGTFVVGKTLSGRKKFQKTFIKNFITGITKKSNYTPVAQVKKKLKVVEFKRIIRNTITDKTKCVSPKCNI